MACWGNVRPWTRFSCLRGGTSARRCAVVCGELESQENRADILNMAHNHENVMKFFKTQKIQRPQRRTIKQLLMNIHSEDFVHNWLKEVNNKDNLEGLVDIIASLPDITVDIGIIKQLYSD